MGRQTFKYYCLHFLGVTTSIWCRFLRLQSKAPGPGVWLISHSDVGHAHVESLPLLASARVLCHPFPRVLRGGCWIVGDDGGRKSSAEFYLSVLYNSRTLFNIVSRLRIISRNDGERSQPRGRGPGGPARLRCPGYRGFGFHFSTTGLWTAHQAQQWSASRRNGPRSRARD